MDARVVQRVLEKVYGLADSATTVGAKSAEAVARDARLPDALKQKIASLYREESLRRAELHAALGLALCRALSGELASDDQAARDLLEFYRARFDAIHENARAERQRDFSESKELELL